MKKLALFLLVVVLAGAAAAWVIDSRLRAPYRGYTGVEQFVDIPPGAGTRAIGERLVAAGVVRDQVTYRAALWLSGQSRRLKAGEYRFDAPMTPADVLGKIARGEVYVISVTFPEGLTIAEMSKIFEAHGLGPASAFVEPPRGIPRSSARSIRSRTISRGICFPRPTRCRATSTRPGSCA